MCVCVHVCMCVSVRAHTHINAWYVHLYNVHIVCIGYSVRVFILEKSIEL